MVLIITMGCAVTKANLVRQSNNGYSTLKMSRKLYNLNLPCSPMHYGTKQYNGKLFPLNYNLP